MSEKEYKKYQSLASICDGTFGKTNFLSSGTESVTLKVLEVTDKPLISARFMMIVNFGSENEMKQLMPRFKNQGLSMIEAALNKLKEDFKDKTGDTLKCKIDSHTLQDSVEFTSYQMSNPKKTGYFRLSCNVKVV